MMTTVYVAQRTTDDLYHSSPMYEADLAKAKFMTKEGAINVVKRYRKSHGRIWQVVAVDLVAQPFDAKLNDF